jgi:hypothetical protein
MIVDRLTGPPRPAPPRPAPPRPAPPRPAPPRPAPPRHTLPYCPALLPYPTALPPAVSCRILPYPALPYAYGECCVIAALAPDLSKSHERAASTGLRTCVAQPITSLTRGIVGYCRDSAEDTHWRGAGTRIEAKSRAGAVLRADQIKELHALPRRIARMLTEVGRPGNR